MPKCRSADHCHAFGLDQHDQNECQVFARVLRVASQQQEQEQPGQELGWLLAESSSLDRECDNKRCCLFMFVHLPNSLCIFFFASLKRFVVTAKLPKKFLDMVFLTPLRGGIGKWRGKVI